ncbi:MAG: hypothetical protein R2736_15935 [Solirubrobacterales bacterium]
MSEHDRPSIADDQRSPASEAADDVEFGPSGVTEADEERPEPTGAAKATAPKTGPDGKPVVAPSRKGN